MLRTIKSMLCKQGVERAFVETHQRRRYFPFLKHFKVIGHRGFFKLKAA